MAIAPSMRAGHRRVSWIDDGEQTPKPVTDYFRHVPGDERISVAAERTLDCRQLFRRGQRTSTGVLDRVSEATIWSAFAQHVVIAAC